MSRRGAYGLCALLVLVVLAGCTTFGGATSESGLGENASYDWETETDVVIDLEGDEYTAVHAIENRSSVRVYQSTRYGIENPLGIEAVKFRYPNGTVVNASALDFSETRSEVHVNLPAEHGHLAYTAPKQSKEFTTPVFTDGSYTVIVPEGHRVGNFVLGTVRPGGAETEMVDNRVHITWDDLSSGPIRVDYYLARDLYLFAGVIVVAGVGAAIGIAYVYRQIQELRRRRKELGLDLDVEDSGDGRPPPGRR